jgi:hypothetical protein
MYRKVKRDKFNFSWTPHYSTLIFHSVGEWIKQSTAYIVYIWKWLISFFILMVKDWQSHESSW